MPEANFIIKRKCKFCGDEFYAKNIDSVYCSRRCSNLAYKRRLKKRRKQELFLKMAKDIPDTEDFITVAQAVIIFGISRNTIHNLIHKGKVLAVNLGKHKTHVSRTSLAMLCPPLAEALADTAPLSKSYNLEPENCYTIGEISKMFHMSEKSVYIHIRKYSIPIRQIGRFVYAPKSEIDKIYESL